MEPQTITYKTVGSLPIKLDIYESPQANSPILIWFHGGGLLQGSRKRLAPHTVAGVSKHGYTLVSADYRLAPQATIEEILSDVIDCLEFVRSKFNTSIAVSGSSAGGYLALLAGLHSDVPKVILPIYPITNPYGKFFTTPQPTPENVQKSVVAPYLDPAADAVADNEPTSPRNKMYFYMMQEANLAELLSMKPGFIIAEELRKRRSYLPCFVVHGDADAFVGVEQADEVVEALKEIGAEYEYQRLPGLNHLFDVDEKFEMEKMYAFMKRHV